MKTQQDTKVRMVALENLRAMCTHVSGVCHTYEVTSVSRSRVHVTYSNPDEYGHEHPMTAVFPCYPSSWPDDANNPRVVLDILRVLNDNWHGEGWQAFDTLLGCPTLWRGGKHAHAADIGQWRTHRQIRESGRETKPYNDHDHDTCVVCDLP